MWLCADGLLIAGAKYKSSSYVWDLSREAGPVILVADGDPPGHMPLAAARIERDQSILIFSNDGILRRWNLKERRIQDTISLQFLLEPIIFNSKLKETFNSAILYRAGSRLAAIGTGFGLRVVDVEKRTEIGRFPRAHLVVASLDEKYLASLHTG